MISDRKRLSRLQRRRVAQRVLGLPNDSSVAWTVWLTARQSSSGLTQPHSARRVVDSVSEAISTPVATGDFTPARASTGPRTRLPYVREAGTVSK